MPAERILRNGSQPMNRNQPVLAHHSRMSRAARALAALLLALAWTLAPEPARAASDPALERPVAGERITTQGPYTVTASVDVASGEEVRRMEARLLADGEQIGEVQPLDFTEVQQTGPGMRRSRWNMRLDPLNTAWAGGGALPNGQFRLEVRALLAFHGVQREPQEWRGHEFVIDVDPPATEVHATVLEADQHKVEVSWGAVDVPDFVRYLVQRKVGDEPWQDYREITDAESTRWADVVPADGSYAYRVQTHRAAADGGERVSLWSNGSVVHVRKPAPPTTSPGTEAGDEGGAGPPPPPSVRTAPQPRRQTWTGPDTYEETLDYGDAEPPPMASGPAPDFAEQPAEEPGELSIGGGGERDPRLVVVPVAAGLLLTMSAWHVRRFIRA